MSVVEKKTIAERTDVLWKEGAAGTVNIGTVGNYEYIVYAAVATNAQTGTAQVRVYESVGGNDYGKIPIVVAPGKTEHLIASLDRPLARFQPTSTVKVVVTGTVDLALHYYTEG